MEKSKSIRHCYVVAAHISTQTHTSIKWLLNQALRTKRLPVTIVKKFRSNQRARFGGLWYVLSVPQKSVSFGCFWSLHDGWISFGGRYEYLGHLGDGCGSEFPYVSILAARNRADCCLRVEAHPFRRGLVAQRSVHSEVAAAQSTIDILVFQRGRQE